MRWFRIAACCAIGAAVCAESTRTWEQTRFDEFEKGTADRIALRSDGSLLLAPRFAEIYDAPVAYLWAMARDSRGNLYVGGGPGARVFKIGPDGKSSSFFETDALEVHALAVDASDRLYVATSPDARIYRLDAAGKPALFADPKVKYVWAMAFNGRGELLVAAGDKGEILKVDPSGRVAKFFQCDESHIRALLVEPGGDVVAGTDPGGLVLRIPAAGGSGFVLHQSAKREITALARDAQGSIYAAGVGTRSRPALPAAPAVPALVPTPTPAPLPTTLGGQPAQQQTPQPPAVQPSSPLRAGVTGGSEVIRISADGAPRKIWSSNDDIVYALALGPGGKLILGTGNQGKMYRIENEQVYSVLLKAAPAQITALLEAPGGRVYAATGNVGKVYRLGPELEPKGTFQSDVLDAGAFSRWGRLTWQGRTPPGTRVSVQVRSGNVAAPAQYWSGWSRPVVRPEGDRVEAPPARFVQWQATLETQGADSPVLESVSLAYLTNNIAPVITEVELTPPNYKFPDPSPITPVKTLSLPALGSRPSRTAPSPPQAPRTMNPAKGYLGARWLAQDENEDELTFTVEIRGAQEQTWRLLRDQLAEPYLSWDSSAFADGLYVLRITASDAPSNPAPDALTHSRETEPFRIDNTPPSITGLSAAVEAGRLRVKFRAADALSWIDEAGYSVDGGPWKPAPPVTRLFDARELEWDFDAGGAGPGEHTVAVRVADEFQNQAVEKVVVR